ncbi:MAG: CRISPR-associated protein Cas5 [Candidatus Nitrosotenuis sp.]
MKILTFKISGAFAAFRDPSVTSNQTVYFIPSKSATIGLLGAMMGIERSSNLGEIYGKQYLDFFSKTSIGISFDTENPKKVIYFTNHRSLKEAKTKPYKAELVENPRYTIYVNTDEPNLKKLYESIVKNEFVYSPYLGHAYCPAAISDGRILDTKIVEPEGEKTKSVILDESETYDLTFEVKLEHLSENSTVIVERHLHHFFKDGNLDRRVLKHWIPTNGSELEISSYTGANLTKFIKIADNVVCLY